MVGYKGEKIAVRPGVLFVAVICSILFVSCTDLTEHEMTVEVGLHVISPDGFTVISSVSDIPGARSLMIDPKNIFVLSTEGLIYRYDSETRELVDVYQVDVPSPAGFSQIVFCNLKNTAYFIGSLGKIIEVSIPECTVIAKFTVCPSPAKLALGRDSKYLFVADGSSTRVYQVSIDNNGTYDNFCVQQSIHCMESSQNPDSLFVGTSGEAVVINVMSPNSISGRYVQGIKFKALAAVPDDSIFVSVGDKSVAVFTMSLDGDLMPRPGFWNSRQIEGSNHYVAMGGDWQHAYVLSYVGNNTSRLISYNYRFSESPQELDLPGFPLDLKVSETGAIYALTAEE